MGDAILLKAVRVLKGPDRSRRLILFINRTWFRFAFKWWQRLCNLSTWLKRRGFASSLQLTSDEKKHVQELRDKGFTSFNLSDPSILQEVLNFAESKLERADQIKGAQKVNTKDFWIRLSDEDSNLTNRHPFVKFSLQETLLKVMSSYFGEAAYLDYVLLTLSQPTSGPYQISQLWHFDRDDTVMAKAFIYLSDVKELGDGPFTFFDRTNSSRVNCGFATRHMVDEAVFSQVDQQKKIELIGPKLSVFLVDTSRCMHMGSRIQAGHHRLMLTCSFITNPPLHPWAASRKIEMQGPVSEIQRLATTQI